MDRIFPAVCGIRRTGLQNDLRDLDIRIFRRTEALSGRMSRKIAAIESLIQHKTQRIGIQRGIQGGISIGNFRGGIDSVVALRQNGIVQGIQPQEANITNPVLPVGADTDVLRLQVGVKPSTAAAGCQRGAEVKAQVDGLQMG